jgi:hypothetical protein
VFIGGTECAPAAGNCDELNSIDLMPGVIEAHLANEWKQKDFSKVKDF